MRGLFQNDPVVRYTRDRRGRFATETRARIDALEDEVKRLRFECEKWRRLAQAVTDVLTLYNREKLRISQ